MIPKVIDMRVLKREFSRFSCFIIDLDGVVWKGNEIIPGAVDAVNALLKLDKIVIFMTNNSTLSRKSYIKRLKQIGVNVDSEKLIVVNSAYATALFLKSRIGISEAYVVGEAGLIEELALNDIKIVNNRFKWGMKVDCVVVGLDRDLTYLKLAQAVDAIYHGALFIATNDDSTLPAEHGLLPGAGSIVAAISRATGRDPDFIVGKPQRFIFELALSKAEVNPEDTIVIGDRLDTDIRGARNMGLCSALVLTGVINNPKQVEDSCFKPDFIIKSLADVFK